MKTFILVIKIFFDPLLLPQQKRWLYRLIFTKTKQTRYRMIDGNKRDVLGIAIDQAIDDGLMHNDNLLVLPKQVLDHHKLNSRTGLILNSSPYCTLSILNDRGKNFKELANFIYHNKERVFSD